jgi:hypothetical protein
VNWWIGFASEEVLDEPELGSPKFQAKVMELTDELLKVALKSLARKPKAAVGLGCMVTEKTVSATHADWAMALPFIHTKMANIKMQAFLLYRILMLKSILFSFVV